MELRILGPLEVVGDDGLAADVGGRRPQTLLVALALAAGHPVPADQLIEQVWRGDRLPGRNRLQIHISRLRRVLGAERIATRGAGYALQIPAEAVDAARFGQLVTGGRAALLAQDATAAARLLREALGLWRGPVLPEFADADFARPVITRLEESRLAATEDRIEADLMLGRHGELAGELEALVGEHPLRERLWGQLMISLYRAGRQGDALRAYQRARTMLADELGVDPGPELTRLQGAVLSQDPALGQPARQTAADSPADRTGNLPAAATALIGRQADSDAVAAVLRTSRLVTIVGPGGVGKTRLAIEAARNAGGGYRDGTWLVELAPVPGASAVAAAAAALGVEPESGPGAAGLLQRLGEFLSGRQALLILDNCEHVIGEAARLADHLLARCPHLQIMATSRESLAAAGESLWPLPPLAPGDASRLFLARAQAIAPSFRADETTMAAVHMICARLDGLPLAIELAAARMRAFTPGEILARLDDRFRLLTGGPRTAQARQQTLRAVVDWSYDLLFDDERRVFERMSVFAGECTLAAAEQVCADEIIPRDDIADLLARLVGKSLVIATHTGRGTSFRLLQTLAEYGRERLAGSRDHAAVRTRHARWAASFASVAEAEHGPAWFAGLQAVGAAAITSMLTARLGYLCSVQGRHDEADRWHAQALAAAEKQQHLPMLALACNSKGVTLRNRGRLDEAGQCHHRALDLSRQRGIPAGLAAAHASLGYIAELRHDAATASQHHRASLHAAIEAADPRAQALALEGLAGVASLRDDAHVTGLLLGAAAALREATVATMLGAAAALREMTAGRLTAAERTDIDRAIVRLRDHATLDTSFAEGHRNPQAILNLTAGVTPVPPQQDRVVPSRTAAPLLRRPKLPAWTGEAEDQVLHHAGGPRRLLDGGRWPGVVV